MMKVKHILASVTTLALMSGCSWFDDVGRHMPVIGKRCENWQCFTESGQAASDAKTRALETEPQRGGAQRIKLNGADNPTTMPASVQTMPAATTPPVQKEPTPFDMTPEQLGGMSSPSSSEY